MSFSTAGATSDYSPTTPSNHPLSPIHPLHHLDRTIDLFQLSKFYHEGFIFRRNLFLSDGLPPKRTDQNITWSKYYVQISGTTMSCWDANEIEIAAQQGRQVAPTYTNITDARVTIPDQHQLASYEQLNCPSPHIFFLNNAGRNQVAFACFDHPSLVQWVSAIRLSSWERSRLFEIYTGTLFGLRFQSSVDSPLPSEKTEGYLMVRFPKDTDWTRVWCQLVKDKSHLLPNSQGPPHHLKWNQRRTSLFQLAGLVNKSNHQNSFSSASLPDTDQEPALMFYPKKGSKKHIGSLRTVSFAAAVYPESRSLIASSTIFKIEGHFERLQPDPRASDPQLGRNTELEGYLLASPDEGTEYDMLGWLSGVMSAFKLYGRPQTFNYDLTDPDSFYFAYPNGPESDKLFLDCQSVAENIDLHEPSISKLRRKFLSLVTARLQAPSHSAVRSPEYKRDLPKLSPQSARSVVDPEYYTDPSAKANLRVVTHSPTQISPSNQTTPLIPAPVEPAWAPDELSSEPYSTLESRENALSRSVSDHTSSTLARPSVNLDDSEELKSIQPSELAPACEPSELTSAIDGELQSLAAYVTYPFEYSDDTPKMLPVSQVSSSDQSSAKSPSRIPLATLDKRSPTPSSPHSSSVGLSPNAPPIKLTTESDELGDMVYAISLMDDLDPAKSSNPNSKDLTVPERLASPKPLSPEPEFLSQPPSNPVELTAISPTSPDSTNLQTIFPSSFAVGKKSAARLAAAQAAQATEKARTHRPGKPGRGEPAAQNKPRSSWNSDSDDDDDDDDKSNEEDEDEEEEEDEDDRLKKHRLGGPASMSNPRLNEKGFQHPQERNNLLHPQVRREAGTSRAGTSMYSTFSHSPDGRPMSHFSTNPTEIGQFPNAAARREMPAVLREQPVESTENSGMKPAFSQHGLLNRVMQERHEKSAKSIQEAAHWTGEPLVQVNHKAPPIQSGLLGAIASHERDRKRDGGMGAVITERARERAMRQRETDEFHRQSMYSMVPGPGFGAAGYPPNALLNSAGLMPMMYNPQLMSSSASMVPNAAGMVPNPAAIYEQMLFQQHQMQMQQQAMMNAQQVYVPPYGYPGMAGGASMGMMGGSGSGVNLSTHGAMMASPHQSMYGFPNQSVNFNQNNNNGQALSPILGAHTGLPTSSSSGNINMNQNQKNHSFNSINSRHF